MRRTLIKNCIQALLMLALLLLVWGVAYHATGNELLIPSPLESLKEMGALFADGGFWVALLGTLGRVLAAFLLSLVLAIILAVAAYVLPALRGFLSPVVSVLRTLPALAVVLIILDLCGASIAPVFVAFLSLFPMLYTGIFAALLQVDRELIEMSDVYQVPLGKRVKQLYLPLAMPYVVREAGAAISFALKLVVSAEVLSLTLKGVGGLMLVSKGDLAISTLFALVGVVVLLGLVFELLFDVLARAMERRWK